MCCPISKKTTSHKCVVLSVQDGATMNETNQKEWFVELLQPLDDLKFACGKTLVSSAFPEHSKGALPSWVYLSFASSYVWVPSCLSSDSWSWSRRHQTVDPFAPSLRAVPPLCLLTKRSNCAVDSTSTQTPLPHHHLDSGRT